MSVTRPGVPGDRLDDDPEDQSEDQNISMVLVLYIFIEDLDDEYTIPMALMTTTMLPMVLMRNMTLLGVLMRGTRSHRLSNKQ